MQRNSAALFPCSTVDHCTCRPGGTGARSVISVDLYRERTVVYRNYDSYQAAGDPIAGPHQEVPMYRTLILMITAGVMIVGGPAVAGTIYTWTDANGVQHYSNTQPPEDAANVQTIDEVDYDAVGADRRRMEFDRMVEQASEEAERHFDQQARQKALQAEQRKQLQKQARAQRVSEEKARLANEIEAIQNRALGPTFTQGMRDNLVRQLQEQIDRLEEGSAN